jgi:hypothetical protein
MPDFFKMSEKELIMLSAAVSVLLIENLNADEQNTLGNFLMAVGQNISSGVFQKELREKLQEDANNKLKDGNAK